MEPVKVEVAKPIYIPIGRPGDNEAATVQVFPLLLSGDPSVERNHFVVCAYFPLLDQAQRQSVAEHLSHRVAGSTCSFIVRDAEGEAVVVSDISEANASALEVAAAVAAVESSHGWDESRPTTVWVNEVKVQVIAQFDGEGWVASFPNVR